MMWAFMAIVVAETLIVHLLVALWKPWLAVVLSVFSIATLVWLIGAIRSFKQLPVELVNGQLIWRAGKLKRVDVPVAQVAGLRRDWEAADLKDRSVLNCALIAYPNVFVELREPVRMGRRSISSLAHRLDDPGSFAAAITHLG
jgi:hypothetical protein